MADYSNLAGGQPTSFVVEAAATGPITGADKKRSWLDYEHPHYEEMKPRWQMVRDFYEGLVVNQDVARRYLARRFQGEPLAAFDERLALTDYTPHLGTLVDSLGGMLFGVEDRASRVWTADDGVVGLGDPADPSTLAFMLWHDADGRGTMWPTLWRQLALDLIAYCEVWVLVDTFSTTSGRPVVKIINPMCVPNWLEGTTGITSVLMKEGRDLRKTLEEDPASEDTWIRWEHEGWTRWTKTSDGTPKQIDEGFYAYQTREGDPTLPIFRVCLPVRRYVTWLLANKMKVLYNMESVRDFGLRTAGFNKLVLSVETDEQFEGLRRRISQGENLLPLSKNVSSAHQYIQPPSEPTTNATNVLDKKVEHFWISGFKMYADAASAQQKTATEINQDVASGVGAFLQLLKAGVDDAENGAFYRLEQAEFSESKNKWGIARVERSDDFSSIDLGAVLDQMRKRYLGETETIPVGRDALIQMAKDAAHQDGLPVDDNEIKTAVDSYLLNKYLKPLTDLGAMPPLVKSRLTMKLVAALGLVDSKEEVEMAEGEKQKLFDVLAAESESIATQQYQQEQQMSQIALQTARAGGGNFPPG